MSRPIDDTPRPLALDQEAAAPRSGAGEGVVQSTAEIRHDGVVTRAGELVVLHLAGERVAMGFATVPAIRVGGDSLPPLVVRGATVFGGARRWREVRRVNDFTPRELEILHDGDGAAGLELWVPIDAEVERIAIPAGPITLVAKSVHRIEPDGYRGAAKGLDHLEVRSIELPPASGLGIEPRHLGHHRITSTQATKTMGRLFFAFFVLALLLILVHGAVR